MDPYRDIPLTPAAQPIANPTPVSTPSPVPTPAPAKPVTVALAPEVPAPIERHGSRPGIGAIVGIVIIVVLLIFGALYFWGAHLNALDRQRTAASSGAAAQ
jgi:hypothetical protein